jgi:hypothetical protein
MIQHVVRFQYTGRTEFFSPKIIHQLMKGMCTFYFAKTKLVLRG